MVANRVAWRDDVSRQLTTTTNGHVRPSSAPVISDNNNKQIALPLRDFLECFPPPQTGRILDDYHPDFDADEAFDLPRGAALQFHRKVNPNVPLSFRDPWGGTGTERWVKVTLPLEFKGLFRLLPYDPVSGDCSPDHIYKTVADLVKAFPVYVQANASLGDTNPARNSRIFKCGERFKLTRFVYEHGERFLECRPLSGTRLLLLPMSAVGNFTAISDDFEYPLAELVAMATRRRRVRLASGDRNRVPGLPAGFDGELYVEEADTFVEASPLSEPGLIIGLPQDINMVVSPVAESYERGLLLNNFATNNRNLFPLVARVTSWQEETPILERHLVRPGVEIVIHGWTRQSKVLAKCNEQCYAIPVTYQGKLRIKPAQFHGVNALSTSRPSYRIRVVHVDLAETDFPLAVGDVIRLKRGEPASGYLRCERVTAEGTLRTREIRLPSASTACFEEVLDETKTAEFSVGALLDSLSERPLTVALVRPSADQRRAGVSWDDLPLDKPLTLCDVIVEPAVYVSVRTPDAPAFHVPLRTLVRVTFVEQLERDASPLLTRCAPRLSTLDRCVERLPTDVFEALRPDVANDGQMTPLGTAASTLDNHAAATTWNGSCSPQHPGPPSFFSSLSNNASEQTGKKTPSVIGSESSLSKSQSFGSKLKNKFRRHKSTENIPKLGKTVGEERPVSNGHQHKEVATVTASVNGNSNEVSRTASLSSRVSQTTASIGSVKDTKQARVISGVNSTNKEDGEDSASEYAFKTNVKFALSIPADGNLYDFSVSQMAELLGELRVDARSVHAVKRDAIDGRRFARMSQADLDRYGILNAVVVHFRKATRRRPASKFML